LVVADKRVTATDVFQGIAVSSDSWLDIAEVAPLDLVRALQEYRRKGYRILGLEQTDTSVSLASASLPGKCVLLLGHEKEGIPVHLLDEVDVCVEIPQLGVIRSLNVHVSCALAIWEISKQNRFSA
jgi:tRNA G18 (ribose-2'-O)-methylase SpoU